VKRLIAACVIAASATGCSFMSSRPQPGRFEVSTAPRCFGDGIAPVLDLVAATPVGIASVWYSTEPTKPGPTIAFATLAGALWASAVYGWIIRGRCRALHEAHERYQLEQWQPPGKR
jgi:hypothetical protein